MEKKRVRIYVDVDVETKRMYDELRQKENIKFYLQIPAWIKQLHKDLITDWNDK